MNLSAVVSSLEKTANQYKLIRWWKGGLWVQFFLNERWEQCEWADESIGYITNPYDGGMFHEKFNGIQYIEDYENGNFYKPPRK